VNAGSLAAKDSSHCWEGNAVAKTERFLHRGHAIKRGDKVKTVDQNSGIVSYYQVERVWGSHAIMRAITELEAGPSPILITVQREAGTASKV
jgi:hypothetical protein